MKRLVIRLLAVLPLFVATLAVGCNKEPLPTVPTVTATPSDSATDTPRKTGPPKDER